MLLAVFEHFKSGYLTHYGLNPCYYMFYYYYVFEHFKSGYFTHYGLTPCHYMLLLLWDAILKMNDVKIRFSDTNNHLN